MSEILASAGGMAETVRVRVRDLLPGDVCTGSGAAILHRPYVQCRTPARKRVVEVRYRNGREAAAIWGADTSITVRRPLEQLTLTEREAPHGS